MPFAATWTDLEMITLSEVSQKGKDKHDYHSYLESNFFKMMQMNLHNRNRLRLQKQSYGYSRGNMGWGGINQELGINIHTLLHVR